ncbi:MAG: UvrD-helicase domain-containing protein [Rhodoferax sp.]
MSVVEQIPAAYACNGAPVSAERFYALACDPRRSVAVEACAGAGKTWMLVSRMLRALLDGVQPQEILAITFTKKAAGEMRERLHQWLDEFAQADDARLVQELRWRGLAQPSAAQVQGLRGLRARLLAQGRGVQVRTFHSWFSALLHNAPWGLLERLGLPQRYTLLEDVGQAERLLWRRFWASVTADAELLADYRASVAEYGRFNTHKALQAALDKRVEFALADAHGVVDASVQPVGAVFADYAGLDDPDQRLRAPGARALLWDAARVLGAASQASMQKIATALQAALDAGDAAALEAALLTQKGEPRKLLDSVAQVELARAAQALLLEHRQALRQHRAWQHQQRMARLARQLLRDFARVKSANGWLDMGDLERAAHTLLSDAVLGAWVQERLDAQVRQLLIDEFQDTNPLQWQALQAWLSGYAGAGQAPGVFIVGDPKQSIYRFRRAEPQVFLAAQAFVREALGGDLLSCDHTRRNAPGVVALVNQTLLAAQARGAVQGFRAHTTASSDGAQVLVLPPIPRQQEPQTVECGAGSGATATAAVQGVDTPEREAAGGAVAWRDSLGTPRHSPEEGRRVLEARQLAHWLAQEIGAGHLQPQEVMVLSRKRAPLGLVQAQLWALGIASVQPEKADLSEQPEVQDVVALLDALLNPGHELALARALKSPLFGWSDETLMELVRCARAVPGQTLWGALMACEREAQAGEAPAHGADAAPNGLLQAAAQRLCCWGRWLQQAAPHDALARIYDDGDVLARFAAAAPATARAGVVAHLQAVLGAALALEGGRFVGAYALVRALRQPGQQAPLRTQEQAARLLTVHGAKGLEARCVVLLDTDAPPARAPSMGVLLEWPGEAAYPQRLAFVASESAPPPCTQVALEREQRERAREDYNALYVALTRAQQMLVFSSIAPHRPSSESWWQQLHGQAQMLSVPEAPASASASAGAAGAPGAMGALAAPQAGRAEAVDGAPGCSGPGHATAAAQGWVPDAAQGAPGTFVLDTVPTLVEGEKRHSARVNIEDDAIKNIANEEPGEPLGMAQQPLLARLGQAMHRLLEWAPVCAGGHAPGGRPWSDAQALAVQQAFALDASQGAQVLAQASAVLLGQGAWAWDADALAWHGNEVPLVAQGRALRLDRLVQRRDNGQWWVLDHKSSTRPLEQADLCAQLAAYLVAVRSLVGAGAVVRGAFLSPDGVSWELQGV